jgi:hypothetical protein
VFDTALLVDARSRIAEGEGVIGPYLVSVRHLPVADAATLLARWVRAHGTRGRARRGLVLQPEIVTWLVRG